MIIKKIDLLEALEIVKPGLASKELIEQTTSFAFKKGYVVTYNDRISISHPIEGSKIKGAVQAEFLYKLLSKVKKEEIEIIQKENELQIQSGRMKAKLALQKKISLPLTDAGAITDWYPLPDRFIHHLNFAVSACSKDMSKPILNCVHVDKKGCIEASDGLRILNCTLQNELPIGSFLIFAAEVLEVVKLNPVEIAEDKGWIHFRTEAGTILSSRILTDKFPDTSKFLNVEGKPIVFPKTINSVLERASIFAKRDFILDESVTVVLKDKRMILSSTAEGASFKEEVNFKYEGDEISFKIIPILLRGILEEVKECIYNGNSLYFSSEDWQYLTLLKT